MKVKMTHRIVNNNLEKLIDQSHNWLQNNKKYEINLRQNKKIRLIQSDFNHKTRDCKVDALTVENEGFIVCLDDMKS